MSKVILGMPGAWAEDNYEAADHYTTKIGGIPDWPALVEPDLLRCSICESILCLVAQIYAPISSTSLMIEERLVYVFGCVSSDCGNTPESWRALRVQRSCEIKKPNADVTEMCDSATSSLDSKEEELDDDNDDVDIDLDDLYNGFSDIANTTSISNHRNISHHPKAAKPKKTRVVGNNSNTLVPVVPCFYIYTQEEAFSKKIDSTISSYNSLSLKDNHNDLEDEKWDEEGYEYDKALNADRTYLKFQKRMDSYPQQCFRYSFGGKPLMAKEENLDPRACCLCGGSRHYEMQLMPPVLYFIESAINENHKFSLENWNWMTLIVSTCSKSCSKPSDNETLTNEGWFVVEEAVVLQYE